MAEETVDHFGIDVGVDNFAQFENHMNRVNEILGAFGQKANQFAADAAVFDRAIQAMKDAGNTAREAIGGLTGILRSGIGDTKSLNSKASAIRKIADAYRDLAAALNGLKGVPTDINLPNTPKASAPRASAPAQPKATGPPPSASSGSRNVSEDAINALSSRVLDQMVAADQARKNFVTNTRADVATQQQLFQNLVQLASTEEASFFALLAKLQADATAANSQALQSFSRGVTINTAAANQQAREAVKASALTQKQQETADAIRKRMTDRQIADGERAADSARKVAEQISVVHQKAFQDDAKAQDRAAKEAAQAQAQAAREAAKMQADAAKQAAQQAAQAQTQAAAQNKTDIKFGNLAINVNDAISKAESTLRGRLADALLNRGDENKLKAQIGEIVSDLRAQFSSIQKGDSSEANILNLKALKKQIDEVTAATSRQIAETKKAETGGPSVAFLAAQRLRNQTEGLTAQEFAIGKIAQAANSANPIIRTFARTIFAVEDAAAASRLSLEAFGIVTQKILATLNAISLPIRLVTSALNLFGITGESVVGVLARLAGFKGAQGIASLDNEIKGLQGTFKNLDLGAFDKVIQKTGENAKKTGEEFRTFAFELEAIDQKQMTAGKTQGAESARASAVQKLATIEKAATDQIAQIEQARAKIQEQIASSGAEKETEATQRKVAKLLELEQNANTQIAALEQARASAQQKSAEIRAPKGVQAQVGVEAPKTLSGIPAILQSIVGPAQAANASIAAMNSQLSQTQEGFTRTGVVVNEVLGHLIADGVRGAISLLQSLGSQAIQALGEFETLQTSFKTLSLREVLDTQPALSFADAEGVASKQAQELLEWTQKLAIISPFSEGKVADIFKTAQAYDFTSKQAQILTQTVVDFATGTGQSAEAGKNIVVALGQIQAAGKLTGQELRQLTNNGVPALRILADATGQTTEQLHKFLQEGGSIKSSDVITAITKAMGTEFAGAAARSSNTIEGLISSINDLKAVGLRELILPAAQQIAEPLASTIVGSLQDPAFIQGIRDVGQTISNAIATGMNAASSAIGTFLGLIQLIPAPLIAFAKNLALAAAGVLALNAALVVLAPALSVIGTVIATVIAAVSSPIGIAIASIAALYTAWQYNFLGMQTTVTTFVDQTITYLEDLFNQAVTIVSNGVASLVAFFQNGGLAQIPSIVSGYVASITATFQSLVAQAQSIGASLMSAWNNNFLGINTTVTSFIGMVTTQFDSLFTSAQSIVSSGLGQVAELFRSSGLSQIPDIVSQIAQSILDVLSELVSSVSEYGQGIVEALADGITSAVGLVVDALSYLGSAVTGLLETHSPPKLLPNLTKWGTGAADAYLEGWTKADFGLFNDLSGQIDKVLQAMGGNQQKPEFVKSVQELLAQATHDFVNTGQVAQQTFDQIRQKFGGYGEEVTRIIQATVTAAAATKQLEDAQSKLSDETKRYQDLLEPIDEQLNKIKQAQDALNTGNEEKKFKNVLQNRFATQEQKQRAQMELERIALEQKKKAIETERDGTLKVLKANVDSAQVAKDNADKVLSVTQSRFDEEFKLISVFQKQAKAANDAADAIDRLKKKKGEKPVLDLGLGKLEDLKLPELKLDDKLSPAIQAAKDRLDSAKQGILDTIQGIRDAFTKGLSGQTVEATSEQNDLGQQVTIIPTRLEEIANGIGRAVGLLQEKVALVEGVFVHLREIFNQGFSGQTETGGKGQEQTQLTGIDALVQKAGSIAGDLNAKFTAITTEVSGFATTFAAAWAKTGTDENGKNVVDRFIETVNSTEVQGKFQGIHDKIVTEINSLFGSSETTGIDWSAITESLQRTLDSFQPSIETLRTNITGAIDGLFGEGTTSGIVTQVQASLDLLFGNVSFDDLSASMTNFTTSVKDALMRIDWSTIIDPSAFTGLSTAASGLMTLIVKPFQDAFNGQGGAQILTDLQTGMGTLISGIGTSIVGIWDTLAAYLKTVDITAITAGASAALSSLVLGAIGGLFSFVVDAITNLGGVHHGEGASAGGGDITGGTAETIAKAITDFIVSAILGIFGAIATAMTLENITSFLKGTLDILAGLGGILLGIVAGVLEGAFSAISKIAEDVNLTAKLNASADAIVKFVSDGVGAIWAGIKSYTEGPLKESQAIIDAATAQISDFINHPADTIVAAFNAVKDKLASLADFSINIPGLGDINPFSTAGETDNKVPVTAEVTKVDTSAVAKPENAPAPIPILAAVDTAAANQAGKDLQAGVAAGVVAAQAEDTSQQSYLDKFLTDWGIKSPSTVADAQIGQPIGQGIVQGIQTALDAGVLDTAKLLSSINGAAEKADTKGAASGATSGLEIAVNLAIAKIQLKQDPAVFTPLAQQINDALMVIDWTTTITEETWGETFTVDTEDSIRNIDWTSTIVQDTWEETFTVTVEKVLRALPWTEITSQTFRSLVARINTVLSSLAWGEITASTFKKLVSRIVSILENLDWGGITDRTFDKLKDHIIGALQDIKWDSITKDTFGGLPKAVVNAIEDIDWTGLVQSSSFSKLQTAIINFVRQTVREALGQQGGNNGTTGPHSAINLPAGTTLDNSVVGRTDAQKIKSAIHNAVEVAAKALSVQTEDQAASRLPTSSRSNTLTTRQRTVTTLAQKLNDVRLSAEEFADDFLDRLFDANGLGYQITRYLEPPTKTFSSAVTRLVASFSVSSGKFGAAGDDIVNLIAVLNPLVVSLNALVSTETALTKSVDALIGKIKAANSNNDPNGPIIIGGPAKSAPVRSANTATARASRTQRTQAAPQQARGLENIVQVTPSTRNELVDLQSFLSALLERNSGTQPVRSGRVITTAPVTLSQAPSVTINNTYVLNQTVSEATAAKSATSFGILKTLVGR